MKKMKFEVVTGPPPTSRTARNNEARRHLIARALKLKEGKGLRTPYNRESKATMLSAKREINKQEKNRYYSFHNLKDDAGKVTHIMLYRQK